MRNEIKQELVKMQKRISELYYGEGEENIGLISVCEDYVQWTIYGIRALAMEHEISWRPFPSSSLEYEATIVIDGVFFLAVGTKKDFVECDLYPVVEGEENE
jgi:hypothetical protein